MITFRADHLDRQDLDLVDLVQDLAVRLSPIADMRDVELQVDTPPTVPITGDAILLQNAIRNLVDNALKYAPRESVVHITVTTTPSPRVTVRDEGPGFPVGEIDGLSDRFTRGSNADGIIGSGLGLTIAQDVAEAHGGELTLGNHPKGGACATFSF
jgi:two-component system sensor histidine kinase TctE